MPWYKVTFSPADVSAGKPLTLQDEFTVLLLANGSPQYAAIFMKARSIGDDLTATDDSISDDDFSGAIIFFSPVAAQIAGGLVARYGGVECERPKRSEVGSFVDSGAAKSLFPPEPDTES
ncbi:MAG TPA: hypothetical protein VKY85_27580 [Candidatus Angelobacter sp.]|nr:hypothetical protein [Candidatus Angelobacter sp.]